MALSVQKGRGRKKRKKGPALSRGAALQVEKSHYGAEPVWPDPKQKKKKKGRPTKADRVRTDVDYLKAMYWYSIFAKDSDRNIWVREYAASAGYTEDQVLLVKKNFSEFLKMKAMIVEARSSAHIARLIVRGCSFAKEDAKAVDQLKKFIQASIDFVPEKKAPPISPADRMLAITETYKGTVDEMVDEVFETKAATDSVQSWLSKKNIPASYMTALANHVEEGYLKELRSKDKDLVEGYSFLKPAEKKKVIKGLEAMVETLVGHAENKKKARKPRKTKGKKPATAEKKVAGLKFMPSLSGEFKLQSFHPEKVMGAKEIVVFNSKSKTILHFIAEDPKVGLDVKGASLMGYDVKKSFGKKVRAGVLKETIEAIEKSGSQKKIRKVTEDLSTKAFGLAPRLNSSCVLWKVWK